MERIKIRAGGREILFRIPDFEDLVIIDESFPLLPVEVDLEKEVSKSPQELIAKLAAEPKKFKRFLGRTTKILTLCAEDPRLRENEEPEGDDDDSLWVREIRGTERIVIGMILIAKAGFDEKSTIEIIPFAETDDSARTPTPSPADTAGDRASSSESAGDGAKSSG